MLQSEFTQRTGVNVSASEFEIINEFYMNCEAGKDEFCKAWVKLNPKRVKEEMERLAEQAKVCKRNEDLADIMMKSQNRAPENADRFFFPAEKKVLEKYGIRLMDKFWPRSSSAVLYDVRQIVCGNYNK